MISSMLRVSGKNFKVREFIKASGWKIKHYWQKGDIVNNETAEKAGFIFEVFYLTRYSTEGYKRTIHELVKFFKKNKRNFKIIRKMGAKTILLDIGIIDDTKFSISAFFEGEILNLAYQNKVNIGTSFYQNEGKKKK